MMSNKKKTLFLGLISFVERYYKFNYLLRESIIIIDQRKKNEYIKVWQNLNLKKKEHKKIIRKLTFLFLINQ